MESDVRYFLDSWSHRSPATGQLIRDSKWFWIDNDCEEPIGPFETKAAAEKDFDEIRKTREAK